MSESRCEWVRTRLPLVENDLGGEEAPVESELNPRERALIDAHLERCPDCRGQLGLLHQAIGVLIAAGREPSETGSSLWPIVERRIREHGSTTDTSWPGRLANRWNRLTASRREHQPLQIVWARDTLRDAKAQMARFEPQSRRTIHMAVSLSAALLVIALVPILAHAPRVHAPSAIHEAPAPIVDRAESPSPRGQDLALDREDDDESETPVTRPDSPRAGNHPGIASASPSRTPATNRPGNDLDNLNGRAIDPRDSRPAY